MLISLNDHTNTETALLIIDLREAARNCNYHCDMTPNVYSSLHQQQWPFQICRSLRAAQETVSDLKKGEGNSKRFDSLPRMH